MKRHLILPIFIIIISYSSYSQETNARMILSDSLSTCSEIQYAVMQLIPMYYQDGIIDTANLMLDYWEKHCGTDETIYRTRVLWAIDSGTFTDTLIDNSTIGYLDLYQWLAFDSSGQSIGSYAYYTPDFGLVKWYESFTDSIAKRATTYPDLSSEERFFVEFYLHPSDSMYSLISSSELKDSKLSGIYNKPVSGELTEWLYHIAANAGIWIPYDKLSTLGMHPSIGGYAGLRHNRMIYNLGLGFQVGSSANDFKVLYKDSVYTTNDFTGINISLEAGRQLINWHRHEFDLLTGLDLELMDVLNLKNDPDNKEDDETKFLKSPSIHLGAGYRYYMNNERYIGLSGRYHLMNIKNNGGTNLRGNALSITLEYGIGANHWLNKKDTFLKQRLPSVK
jgi:hypothetical protein